MGRDGGEIERVELTITLSRLKQSSFILDVLYISIAIICF